MIVEVYLKRVYKISKGDRYMAEFCLACWNQINQINTEKNMYVFSKELALCEGCGKWKPVIVRLHTRYIIGNAAQKLFRRRK